ncbi:MAG: SMP-30/gluconolactonase/LRE family protein [Anaerolineae bacterium]|nr:SMP-30/gluconolactonase/LRE family protein [Anaerolineae bacterium]
MSKPQPLITGLSFGESPRWHDGRLWVSDWGTREIIAVDPDGKSEVMVHLNFPSFQAICMDWLPDGRLLIVSSADGTLLCRQPDGTLATYANLRGLSDKGWNEIVIDSRGNTYVNGGGFNLGSEPFVPGMIGLVTPDGSTRQVADGIAFPNGMAITADNSTLIVAESYAKKLTAFDIVADGSLSNRRIWADLGDGVPDGICVDAGNAIWYADVPNKCCKRVREGGEVLQTVELDRGCFACALGGTDRKTLFIVAREWRGLENTANQELTGQVLTVQAPAAGVGKP